MINRKIRIVIFGGLGFIGKNLATKLAESGMFEVNVLDKKPTAISSGLLSREEVYVSKPRETKSIEENDEIYHFYYDDGMYIAPPDIILHLGEYARVERSMQSKNEFSRVINDNIFGTWKVFENFVNENPDAILFYAGSSTRFSGLKAYTQSPYAFTKYMNSELAHCLNKWYGLKANVIYFYNVFGNGEEVGEYGTVVGNFKKQFLDEKPITVYGGEQTRRFTFVNDVNMSLIDLFLRSIEDQSGGKEYHMTNYSIPEISILELAQMFYDDADMIKIEPMRNGCRMRSLDMRLDSLNFVGSYPNRVKDYIEGLKRWKRDIT